VVVWGVRWVLWVGGGGGGAAGRAPPPGGPGAAPPAGATGLVNVVVSRGCWLFHRRVVRSSPALLVRGRLERAEGVTNVIAEHIDPFPIKASSLRSRDFR
jgi:hypothetical protein